MPLVVPIFLIKSNKSVSFGAANGVKIKHCIFKKKLHNPLLYPIISGSGSLSALPLVVTSLLICIPFNAVV